MYAVPERADILFNFLCAPIGGALRVSDEADRIGWFDRRDLPPNTSPRHVERIGDAFANGDALSMKVQV